MAKVWNPCYRRSLSCFLLLSSWFCLRIFLYGTRLTSALPFPSGSVSPNSSFPVWLSDFSLQASVHIPLACRWIHMRSLSPCLHFSPPSQRGKGRGYPGRVLVPLAHAPSGAQSLASAQQSQGIFGAFCTGLLHKEKLPAKSSEISSYSLPDPAAVSNKGKLQFFFPSSFLLRRLVGSCSRTPASHGSHLSPLGWEVRRDGPSKQCQEGRGQDCRPYSVPETRAVLSELSTST